jgi:cellobiose-specific phosphotransferase system component IIA
MTKLEELEKQLKEAEENLERMHKVKVDLIIEIASIKAEK